MRLVLVEALRVQALVALRRERWDEAASSLAEGLALAQEMPYPHAEARLLQVSERLRALRGEPGATQGIVQCLDERQARSARDGAAAPVGQDRTRAGERRIGMRTTPGTGAASVSPSRRK